MSSIIERITRERPDEYERIKLESVDNSFWVVGRIIVEYYTRDNPSQIHNRLFNSYKEFSFWISSGENKHNVRMLTTKHEIRYPNEMENACCFLRR